MAVVCSMNDVVASCVKAMSSDPYATKASGVQTGIHIAAANSPVGALLHRHDANQRPDDIHPGRSERCDLSS